MEGIVDAIHMPNSVIEAQLRKDEEGGVIVLRVTDPTDAATNLLHIGPLREELIVCHFGEIGDIGR